MCIRDRLSAEPRGVVRVSVPVSLAQQQLPRLLPRFLEQYPQVRLQLHVGNRRVDLINEGFDVALRVRSRLDDDGSLVTVSYTHLDVYKRQTIDCCESGIKMI